MQTMGIFLTFVLACQGVAWVHPWKMYLTYVDEAEECGQIGLLT